MIQRVVNLTSVTCSSLTLSPLHRFDASHLLTVPLQHIHELSMHLRLYLISTSLSTVSLSIWQVQKKMLFQPVPLFMSYLSILSLILSVPSSFNNVFHPFYLHDKVFLLLCSEMSLSHLSSRYPLRPPRLGPDAKACRRAHRSKGKPGATLALEYHSRSPHCWHS